MSRIILRLLLVAVPVIVAACTSQPMGQTTASSAPDPDAYCDLDADELARVQANALAYMAEEWPVLDIECEEMSDSVVYIAPSQCAIFGSPRVDEACSEPSHAGYRIVFSRESLEPYQIYFMTE